MVVGSDISCPTVKGEHVRQLWEKGINGYFNGIPIEKAFNWEHLLSEDIVTVQSALIPCQVLHGTSRKRQRYLFLEKLATVIPNSHSRNVLVQFYLNMLTVFQDESDLLVTLVKFYPLAVTCINMFLRKHFLEYLHEHPNKGENESEIIVWSKTYLLHLFESKDIFIATSTLDWLSQFRYRGVHEFLLTTASNQIPRISKPEYWLFLYRLLGIVVPGPPPTLISSNRYASVLFSIGAAVSPGCPLTPEHFVLMGKRLVYDVELKPVLYTNISLTPGLVGLAAYIMIKYPTPSVLPFIRNVVNIRQGANIHLFGCFMYPLAILGGVNNSKIREEVIEIMTQILNMGPCPPEQKDYISQDDYSEKCIKTQSTLISLKLGQVLSFIAEKGVDLVAKQLQKSKLTTFSATILCHSIVVCEDRPSDLLLSTFRLSDDSTNITILIFLIIHINLVREGKVRQSRKFCYLYMRNFSLIMKNASPAILKKMVKMIFSEAGPASHGDVINASYQILYEIWIDHGGLVYNTFYSMLSNPKYPDRADLDLVIMGIVRRMCSSDRPVDMDDMRKIVYKYLDSSTDDQVIGKCIDSLTYLCLGPRPGGMDFRQVHPIITRYADNPKLSLPICFFYSESVFDCQSPELLDQTVVKLWDFSQSFDCETSAIAYKGLLNSGIDFRLTEDIEETINSLLHQHLHPPYAAEFVASMITRELRENPAQIIGSIPNPTKKLLSDFRVKDFFAAKNLTHALFSFSSVSPTANRQQHKKQLHQNERILSSILNKFTDNEFNDPFDGIIIIEGWNHFMYEYITSLLNMPTYQRRNRADPNSPAMVLEHIKVEVNHLIERELQNSHKMYVLVLTITSLANAVYRIALKSDIFTDQIKNILAKDIGLLRTLTVYNMNSSSKSPKTKAMLLLCSAYVAKIAIDMEDESMLKMLLDACSSNIPPESSINDLVSQCAAIATGVIVHVYYKIKPKTLCIKDAIQIMLDSKHYLGLCFCVDSFCNSIHKSTTRKFIDDISEMNTGVHLMPDRILFMGMLLVFSFHVDNADEQELLDFVTFLGDKIDTTTDALEQKYYLIIQGLVYYNIANWQYSLPSWKHAYQSTIKLYAAKFTDGFGAIPTLSLLTGFPITNLIDYFDWGPSTDGIVTYSDVVTKSLQYEDGRLCSLIIARKFEEHRHTLINYKTLPNSVWDMVNEVIHTALLKQTSDNKRKLKFALEILSHVSCKIPLSNPLEIMVSIFTRTTLQQEVVRCAGIHAKQTSEHFYKFIEKFLSLSVYPQLSLQCQTEIITQLPNFIQFIGKRKLRHTLSNFLNENFWQGSRELRLAILKAFQVLLKTQPSMKNIICETLTNDYFTHANLHLLTPQTVDHIGQLMKTVDFYQLQLNHLIAESRLVVDFIKSRHYIKEVVDLFFKRYLQVELYTPELMRAVVNIVLVLDEDMAYNSLFTVMSKIKKSLEENPENFMNPAIACINTVVLTYIAYLKDVKSIGNGLEQYLYLSDLVEPQMNVDCLAEVLKTLDPWSKINRLYIDVLPSDG